MISIPEYEDILEYLENQTKGITNMNNYLKRVSRRLAKERNAKPSLRPSSLKNKTDWKWKDCLAEIKMKRRDK